MPPPSRSLKTLRALAPSVIVPLALWLASCSDNPTRPGVRTATEYTPSLELYADGPNYMWGRSDHEVYVFARMLLRFDGARWQPLELPPGSEGLRALWGPVDGPLYGVGNNLTGPPRLYRWSNGAWDSAPIPDSFDHLWGADDGEVFTTDLDLVHRYDGSAWRTDSVSVHPGEWLRTITGAGPHDVYVTGYEGMIAHFDGSSWDAQTPDSTLEFDASWTASSRPLYLVGRHTDVFSNDTLYTYDGVHLARAQVPIGFRVDDMFDGTSYPLLTGRYGNCYALLQFDGAAWHSLRCGQDYVYGAWSSGTGTAFSSHSTDVWRTDGAGDTRVLGNGPGSLFNPYYGIWGSESDGVYVVGASAYRYLDGTWANLNKESLTTQVAYSVWGTGAGDIWAVGDGMILHYDGQSWRWLSGGASHSLNGVWASRHEALAVGAGGFIIRYDGDLWLPMTSPTSTFLRAVWGWDGGALAAGDGGVVLRYDGSRWQSVETPFTWNVDCLFGLEPNRVFAVGADPSQVAAFDGKKWTMMETETSMAAGAYNASIWGTSSRNLFVCQSNGTVLHFDGAGWSDLPRVSSEGRAVWGLPNGGLLMATGGAVVRYAKH